MTREIWIDFNSLDEERRTTTLLMYAASPASVVVGARLVVGDDDGYMADAQVIDVTDRGVVTLAVDLGTFCEAEQEHLARAC